MAGCKGATGLSKSHEVSHEIPHYQRLCYLSTYSYALCHQLPCRACWLRLCVVTTIMAHIHVHALESRSLGVITIRACIWVCSIGVVLFDLGRVDRPLLLA